MHEHELDPKQEEKKRTPRKRATDGAQPANWEMRLPPGLLPPEERLLSLQSSRGNRYVQRVVDATRQGIPVLRKTFPAAGYAKVDPQTEADIHQTRGSGSPLPEPFRAEMEVVMGTDFSGVRLHTGAQADQLNQVLSARAFTTGQDIFFRQGEYQPSSSAGRKLVAHELAHVMQQATGRVSGCGSGMTVCPAGDVFEQEADRVMNAINWVDDTPVQRQFLRENKSQGKSVLQCKEALEEQLDIEGGTFLARLKSIFDMNVHDIIDAAWGDIADGIRYMRAGQKEVGEFFFDNAARKLAVFMPQPNQWGPKGLALWSGNNALEYAKEQGYTVLEDTSIGGVLSVLKLNSILPEWPLLRPLWNAISRQYAFMPKSGYVHIFAVAREKIDELLNLSPDKQPVLISTEILTLTKKDQLLRGSGKGAGITQVWHILAPLGGGKLGSIDIKGLFDPNATFDNLAMAAEAMRQYYAYPQLPGSYE